jgi:hypothetical protein
LRAPFSFSASSCGKQLTDASHNHDGSRLPGRSSTDTGRLHRARCRPALLNGYLRYFLRYFLRFLVGVGVRSALQLAMNASHAPRRSGNIACRDFSKQKASISRDAAEAGVAFINARKVTATNTHFGFNVSLLTFQPRLVHQRFQRVPLGAAHRCECCEAAGAAGGENPNWRMMRG